jgi:23S rRNA (guanosine2251-2'-O)-methyltransferase
VIVGRNPVREALEGGTLQIEKVMIQKGAGGRPIEAIRRSASQLGIRVQEVPPARISQLVSGVKHQGVVAIAAPVTYLAVEDLLSAIAADPDEVRQRRPIVLVLDRIEDPHNFGAILRSAVAAGVAGAIVPKHGMAPLSAVALKASAGAALRIPLARATNISEALVQLKERGYWVAGASGDGPTTAWEMDWDRPIALVLGNEARGLGTRVAAQCDYHVSIPMRGPVESLNASVAAGILLFAAVRARQQDA